MKESKIEIVLEKNFFEVGNFINGHVILKTFIPLNVHKITLELTKKRKINVCKLVEEGKDATESRFIDNKIVYKYDYDLYVNNDVTEEISSGKHIFPFKISLKQSDSSSTEIKGIYFDHLVDIKNSYDLSCSLFLMGVYKPMLTAQKELCVVQNIDKEMSFSFKIEMSIILCFFYKSYSLVFKLNKPLYFSGDNLELTVDAGGFKPKIKNIECNLYELLSITTPQINFIRTRYIIGGDVERNSKNNLYVLNLRIPSSTPSTVDEKEFSLKSVIYINITFFNSNPVRLKKYIHLVKKNLEIPNLDCMNVLEGEVFEEKIFVLS